MKSLKVLTVVLLTMLCSYAAIAQPVHRKIHHKRHVVKHYRRHHHRK